LTAEQREKKGLETFSHPLNPERSEMRGHVGGGQPLHPIFRYGGLPHNHHKPQLAGYELGGSQ
jgi:hypothetical protein